MKDQIRNLGLELSKGTSDTLIKVCQVFVRLGLNYWKEQANLHFQKTIQIPEGPEHLAAKAAYGEAFHHWHRLSMMNQSIDSILKNRSIGGPVSLPKEQAA